MNHSFRTPCAAGPLDAGPLFMSGRTEAPDREVKFAPADLTEVDADGTFTGYASLFGVADLGRDIVMPGAFRDSLRRRGAGGVKMLYQHDPADPIGVWLDLREDDRGLRATGRLMTEIARAREVLSLMRAGVLDGLSIGFRTVRGRQDRKSGTRRLLEIDLWEISVVTFPLLPDARVAAVKTVPQDRRLPTPRQFERWLTQDAGLTRTEARTVIRSGFKSLCDRRDAVAASEHMIAAAFRNAAHRIRTMRYQR